MDAVHAQSIDAPEQYHKGGHVCHAEPGGLVVRRGDGEIQKCSSLVPHTVVIAGCDAEAVVAGRRIVIERLPAIADVLPIAIPAIQLNPEMVLLRRYEAESGIVDLQIANERRQPWVRG